MAADLQRVRPEQPSKAAGGNAYAAAAHDCASTYPVVRTCELISVKVGDRLLNSAEADRALLFLQKAGSDIEVATLRAAQCALDAGRVVVPPVSDLDVALAPGQRKVSAGFVYDFAEVAIRLDGRRVLVRVCLTVCPSYPHILGGPDPKDIPKYSKGWVRFILIEGADACTPKELKRFDQACRQIAKAVIAAVLPPYIAALQQAVGPDAGQVTATLDDSGFDIFAINAEAEDFLEIFDATERGEALSAQSSKAAREFVQLAQTVLDLGPDDENVRFMVYDSPGALRGVFVRRMFGKGRARFIGLTRISSDDELLNGSATARPRLVSSNIVTAALAEEFGSRF